MCGEFVRVDLDAELYETLQFKDWFYFIFFVRLLIWIHLSGSKGTVSAQCRLSNSLNFAQSFRSVSLRMPPKWSWLWSRAVNEWSQKSKPSVAVQVLTGRYYAICVIAWTLVLKVKSENGNLCGPSLIKPPAGPKLSACATSLHHEHSCVINTVPTSSMEDVYFSRMWRRLENRSEDFQQ